MKIGISTTDFNQVPAGELFQRISSYGYEVVQLGLTYLEESHFVRDGIYEIPETIDRQLIYAAHSAAELYKLEIVAMNGTFNMAYPDKHVRDEGVRRFASLAEASADIGCGLITLCSGTRNKSHLWAPHPGNADPAAWADMMDTMLRLVDIAERHGIKLAIETEASNIIDTPQKARKALDEISSPRVGMIMDCANLFRRGEAKRENMDTRIREAFELFGDKVLLAHGKDIMESDEISFCAPGEGFVNYHLFLSLLREYSYTGDMILHGIKDANKMPCALEFMRSIIYPQSPAEHDGIAQP